MKQILSFLFLSLFALPFANAQATFPPPIGNTAMRFTVKSQIVYNNTGQNLTITFNREAENAFVTISNSDGRIVHQEVHTLVSGSVIEMSTDTWDNDTYTVTVNFANGTFEKHRFIKK